MLFDPKAPFKSITQGLQKGGGICHNFNAQKFGLWFQKVLSESTPE